MQSNDTIHYYNQKANDFIQRTFSHDMSADQNRFLQYLPPNETILDVGCGSGRDALAFQKAGFQVLAIDASSEMVKHTQSLGVPTQLLRFDEISWKETFGGIWCCASLLHVPPQDLPHIVETIHTAAKQAAILFVSFKQGEGERCENGRYFHMMNEEKLRCFFRSFSLLEIWSQDSDVNLVPTTWLKAIFRK